MWAKLYEQSNQLQGPYLSSSIFSSPLGFEEISSILQGVLLSPTTTKLNYFRSYINGREDYRLVEKLLEQDLDCHSIKNTLNNFFAASKDILREQRGMVVNGGLQWSELVQQKLASETTKLTESISDFFTLDITLFMGAYGSTPFGAHIDDASHRTILFNLGPNEKLIKIWERREVERQFGKVRNIYDFENITAPLKEYMIFPGDCFVLPSNEFHVAINKNISITVAFVINFLELGSLAAHELNFHKAELNYLGELHLLSHLNIFELSTLAKKRYQSNCNLNYPIQLKKSGIEHLKQHSILKVTKPFKLQLIIFDETLIIYSRGRSYITLSMAQRAINKLNEEEQIFVSEFIAIAKEDGYQLKDALAMIDFLLSTSGISFQ
ncbi:MAG: hypothetical protein RSD40_00125 [Bacilli bacterium]